MLQRLTSDYGTTGYLEFGLRTNTNINLTIKPSRIRMELQFRPDTARKLSAKLYNIYHCCVYSEKLLMMDTGTVINM